MSDPHRRGVRLLSAVERILEDDVALRERVQGLLSEHRYREDPVGDTARVLIRRYSNHSMVAGGATAVPALLPGVGTLAAMLGGTAVDLALMLKYEVELALSLSVAHGHDISNPEERQLAYLLASVGTYDAQSGHDILSDLAAVEAEALWTYGPREVSKLLLTVLSKLALLTLGKGLARAVPLVGVAVSGGVNKVLTQRVGRRIHQVLIERRRVEPTEE